VPRTVRFTVPDIADWAMFLFHHFALLISCLIAVSSGQPENKAPHTGFHHPALGQHVYVFEPDMSMDRIQVTLDSIFELQRHRESEFNANRFALMFMPGEYALDFRVGYYMQVLGLGASPEDVVIRGAVRSNSRRGRGHVLTNFWRAVENLTIDPDTGVNTWGVSQAAPIRRVHVKGDLQLHDFGYASGGFMADTRVDGTVMAGGHQQWYSRNCELGAWDKGVWNILSMGVEGVPATDFPEGPYTTFDAVPVSREKPYLVYGDDAFLLRIPDVRYRSSGISWTGDEPIERDLPLSDMYIASPEKDNASSLNSALKQGLDLLFTPGVYLLEEGLRVRRSGTVIAGLGMPSLVPVKGNRAICTGDAEDVVISGLLFDAGPLLSESLLEVGSEAQEPGHRAGPTWLFDLFFRVGGPAAGSVTSCVVINSNDVFIDHIWLWRADHGNGVAWGLNRSDHGLVVNGHRVTAYGLFNEHHQHYQTIWNGEQGRVFLYQSEMPYDPPDPEAWMNNGKGGFASYKVADHVKSHSAWGVGVYCVFHDAPIVVETGIETPAALEDSIRHIFTVFLGGNRQSRLKHVINDKGKQVDPSHRRSRMK